MKKPVRQKMPARKVCDVKAALASADSSIHAAAVKAEYRRRKYRSKKVLLDEFNNLLRRVEFDHKKLIGLERVTGISFEGGRCSTFIYNVSIDGVPYRVSTLQGAIDFLQGFSSGLACARGSVLPDSADSLNHGQLMIGKGA